MKARAAAIVVLAVALAAPAALAGPWGGRKKPDGGRRAELVREGDALLSQARLAVGPQPTLGTSQTERLARAAIAKYQEAMALGPAPGDADLHLRSFQATLWYFTDSRQKWERAIAHFDAYRAADPLDPRENDAIPDLCTALSKLAGTGGPNADQYYARGVAEYDRWRRRIDETDPRFARALGTYYTNAAELLMALGPDRIEDAIRYYQAGVEYTGATGYPSLAYYGLAVAYDRDGQWERAVDAMNEALVRDHGRDGSMLDLSAHGVYFVPEGDVYYYYALGYHVQGRRAEALAMYKKFLAECKDTRYAERAREHIAELEAHAPRRSAR